MERRGQVKDDVGKGWFRNRVSNGRECNAEMLPSNGRECNAETLWRCCGTMAGGALALEESLT